MQKNPVDAIEVNFDGIVGPTHNYAGLSYGNIASMKHQGKLSHPKQAALQGLKKMKLLKDLGCVQGFLPPHERPSLVDLKRLGFHGSDREILKKAYEQDPVLLSACSSASSMWAANVATVSPSCDTYDGKVHITISNLHYSFHRSIEIPTTFRVFSTIFSNSDYFSVHLPLPSGGNFGDEGAANHSRFCHSYGEKGVHLFVYGRHIFEHGVTHRYPPRHCFETSEAIVRQHGLQKQQVVFAQQNPELIDLGVFHNDVISVGDRLVFVYHERAFIKTKEVIEELKQKVHTICGRSLECVEISQQDLPVEKAVSTYFFNSQIISLKNDSQVWIAPQEASSLSIPLPFKEKVFVNVKESMQNGGGPACLRLRVVLTPEEFQKINPHFILTDALYEELDSWIHNYYRDDLNFEDLADPELLKESREALDALTQLLGVENLYSFQGE